MKSSYYALYLRGKQTPDSSQGGFTLMELLVAVIIISILATIALPNLLNQIGKARDAELRNTTGTITRAQHAYHFENFGFTNNISSLGVTISTQYQTNPSINTDTTTHATVRTNGLNSSQSQIRAFASRIEYDAAGADYSFIFCSSLLPSDTMPAPSNTTSCPAGSTQIR